MKSEWEKEREEDKNRRTEKAEAQGRRKKTVREKKSCGLWSCPNPILLELGFFSFFNKHFSISSLFFLGNLRRTVVFANNDQK